MQTNTVSKELNRLNSGASVIACPENNMWFTESPEYAAFIAELKESIQNHDVRGSILIATDREIIWASGSRSVDVNGDTVTPLTTYEVGSITKMMTSAIIFELIDEGKLAVTDRVSAYFPEYSRANGMTVFDLLHMRSGIVDFFKASETFFHHDEALIDALNDGRITDEVFLEQLYALDLAFEPNTKMEYCNTNYVLLAMIIEKVTGKSYQENVRERIFEPLDMEYSSATTYGDVTSVPEGKNGYMKEYQIARGAGDIHSNVLDILKFDRAFFNEQIVSPAGKAGMLDFVDDYGCGWEPSSPYTDAVMHDGTTNSYSALNAAFHASDAEKRCYFIMLNCCNGAGEKNKEAFFQFQLIFDLCYKHLP